MSESDELPARLIIFEAFTHRNIHILLEDAEKPLSYFVVISTFICLQGRPGGCQRVQSLEKVYHACVACCC